MSDRNNRLKLWKWVGTDPFLRSQFNDNWDQLIANPGYYPCTSTTRPAWAAAQSGMIIAETDTRRLLQWTGTQFVPFNQYTTSFRGGIRPNLSLGKNAQTTQTVLSVTVPRACTINVISACRWSCGADDIQSTYFWNYIDGTSADTFGGWVLFGATGSSTASNENTTATVVGSRAVSAGTHTIQIHAVIGTGSRPVVFQQASSLVFLSE